MENTFLFGIDLDHPAINSMDDFTTYLTALEVAGRPLPTQSKLEEGFFQYRESTGSSGVNPNYENKKESKPMVKKEYSLEVISKAFAKNLNLHIRSDFKKVKELGGFMETDLIKYQKLINGVKRFVNINLALEHKFLSDVKNALSTIKDNIKLLDDNNCNIAIDKTVDKMTERVFEITTTLQ